MQFKVGDRVRIINLGGGHLPSGDYVLSFVGGDLITRQVFKVLERPEETFGGGGGIYYDIKLIKETTNMNIKEKFVLALTPEPQKSFRKAGITNGDDLLTDDGQKIFLSWLLKKNQDDFKKEVVDDLLKEEDN